MTTDRQQIAGVILDRLGKFMPEIAQDPPSEDKDLRDYASFDSLGLLEVLVWLESEFAVTIPDEDLVVDHFSTVGRMVDYVVSRRP
ncbi:phosphopantetheine-binding protein [Micromonospora echinospora]